MSAESARSETAPAQGGTGAGRHSVAGVVFILLCAVVLVNQWGAIFPGQDWLAASVVVMGLAAAVASLTPVLPWPNVLVATVLASFIGGMAEAISGATGFPFGRGGFHSVAGPLLLGFIPWWLPLVWPTIALSARGTARLILHRFRRHPLHGYRVIGLAAALALVGVVSLEMFATRAAHLWTPNTPPVLNYTSGFMLHLFIQVAMTPLLLDKFPGQRPPNFRPLVVWAGFNVLLLAGVIFS